MTVLFSQTDYSTRFLNSLLADVLIISGTKDPVFLPALTQRYVERLRGFGMQPTWMRLGCGHYTLALFPYNILAFSKAYLYLRRHL
jgi:hypothetical protein